MTEMGGVTGSFGGVGVKGDTLTARLPMKAGGGAFGS